MDDMDEVISPEAFVNEFKALKNDLLKDYFSEDSEGSRVRLLADAGLNQAQMALVKTVLDDALTDGFYTVLLGLEGCSSIHQHQTSYKLFNEQGLELTGALDVLAYEVFYEACVD